MIKAIIFDCFGVLAEDGWLPFKRAHIGDNPELVQALIDLGKQNEYGMIENAEYNRQVAELIGVSEDELANALGRKVANEQLFEFIKTLKPRLKIGLLSNANYNVMEDLFTQEQASLIDAAVLSYECRMIKPDPRMYQLIADRLGVLPEECVFVDDLERYAIASEEVGMTGIWYTDFDKFVASLPV